MRTEQMFDMNKVNFINTHDRIKDFISMNIGYWCNRRALFMEEQASFTSNQKWKIDWYVPSLNLAIFFEKHKDIFRAASDAGYETILLTQANYRSLLAMLDAAYVRRIKYC